jgi:tetratricopeptide (TPR) repeat protein
MFQPTRNSLESIAGVNVMTRSVGSIFLNTFLGAIVLTGLLCAPLVAQDKISPVSDYQYKRDYAQYDKIKAETDCTKKTEALVAFMKEHPISRMLPYVQADYLGCVKPAIDAKDWNKVIAMEEAFMALLPTEKSVQAAQVPEPGAGEFVKTQLKPARQGMQQALMAAYFQANNMAKAAELAESMYAETQDKNMIPVLMQIYQKANQADKFLVYAEKLVAEFPIEQSYQAALQAAAVYAQKGDLAKAVDYANKVMTAFGDKVPAGLQEAQWNTSRAFAYGLMGAAAYAKQDFPAAIAEYEKVIKFAPKADDTPYYYIGMSKWKSKDPEGAIEAFAKTSVMGKANAKKAEDYLQQLWKARHNDSLDGLDQVKAKAKADLGL